MSAQDRPVGNPEAPVITVDLQTLRDALDDSVEAASKALAQIAEAQMVTQKDLQLEFSV